jgi:hypothetical protein
MNTKDVKVDLDALERVTNSALTWDFISLSAFFVAANPAAVLELVRRLREAESELAACREDAEQYRWLRRNVGVERTCGGKGPISIYLLIKPPASDSISIETDAAIRAARAKEGGAK